MRYCTMIAGFLLLAGFLGCQKDGIEEEFVGEYQWEYSAVSPDRWSSYHAYNYHVSNPSNRFTLKAKANGSFVLFKNGGRVGRYKSEDVNPSFTDDRLFLETIPIKGAHTSSFYRGDLDCSDRDEWIGTYRGIYREKQEKEDPETNNCEFPYYWDVIDGKEIEILAHESSEACLLYISIDSNGLEYDAPFALDLNPKRLLPNQGEVHRNGDSLIIKRHPFGRYGCGMKYEFRGVKIN